MLISDCIRAAGMGEVRHTLKLGEQNEDGVEFEINDGVAVILGQNLYAGSITTVDEMVKNLIKYSNVPLEQAVYMATEAPAKLLGLDSIGSRLRQVDMLT